MLTHVSKQVAFDARAGCQLWTALFIAVIITILEVLWFNKALIVAGWVVVVKRKIYGLSRVIFYIINLLHFN